MNALPERFGVRFALTSVVAVLFFLSPLTAAEQPAAKVRRVGFLGNSTASLEAHLVAPFRDGLRDLGYLEGRNVVIECRWAEGKYERFPAIIAELVALKVDVIVTAGTPATQAVQKATTTIPLVMVAVGDPVGTGIVASLKRPGGNITGLTSIADETQGKRLELLRELLPRVSSVAVLANPDNQSAAGVVKECLDAARTVGMKVHVLEARTLGELEQTFKGIVTERPGALIVLGDRFFLHNRERIMDFTTKQRLPTVPLHPELVDAGGLFFYGPAIQVCTGEPPTSWTES